MHKSSATGWKYSTTHRWVATRLLRNTDLHSVPSIVVLVRALAIVRKCALAFACKYSCQPMPVFTQAKE